MGFLIAALLLAAAADAPPITGFYRSNQMEVGAALELDPDGRFMYQLDYGAVSEAAEGTWSSDGTTVYLTATRMEGAYQTHSFSREPLKIQDDQLLLGRYDIVIRFEREVEKRTAPSSPDFSTLPVPADKK